MLNSMKMDNIYFCLKKEKEGIAKRLMRFISSF